MKLQNARYHLIAFIVVCIWGVTFISTKVLLAAGLSPEDILFYRFILAYIGIWFCGKNRLFGKSWQDEFKFLLLGISGGSLYFLTENLALKITLASNVALIVCIAPIVTTILSHLLLKEKLTRNLIWGSLLAFLGVSLVVFNGNFILKMNPLGDFLCLAAALCWAFYTIILKQVGNRYSILFVTRKVFFYGIVTVLPVFCFKPLTIDMAIISQTEVWLNLLFLGLVASLLCFFLWNLTIKQLGTIPTTNYIYFVPLITLIASALILYEKITVVALLGAIFILSGVFISGKK